MFSLDKNKKEILKGIQIDAPLVFVPWCIKVDEVEALFKKYPLSRISDDYFTIKDVIISIPYLVILASILMEC